ncbi:MAG: hypothetical protein EHM81_07080 [Chloroflexi bacterium]|nr:MAG: hypothetical protein EHM81_07080 [Chloroflexota bacterium]
MYFFVRFTGIVILVSGVFLMLLGFGGAIYAFIQSASLTDLVNQYIFQALQSNLRVTDTRFFTSIAGLGVFVLGMGVAAMGQLMLVFADIASNTRETTALLRGMRRSELAAPARTTREADSDRAGLASPAKPAREVDLDQIEFVQTVKPPRKLGLSKTEPIKPPKGVGENPVTAWGDDLDDAPRG